MNKRNYSISILVATLLLVVLIVLGENYVQNSVKRQKVLYHSRMTPTIFVPGSSATKERFNDMIDFFNSKQIKHSVLKVEVSKNNRLTYYGNIQSKDNNPFIVIAFEDNRDGYETIKKQAEWLSIAMTDLQVRYKFQHFNAIGHSNGGLNWTIFLENGYLASNFHMDHLLTIATPFNFEESNSSNKTQMLKDLIDSREMLPSDLSVYNLAGTDSYDGDKIVPFSSVDCGKYIFQKMVKHYTQLTVTGDAATHSDLPSNPEVMQFIEDKILRPNPSDKIHNKE